MMRILRIYTDEEVVIVEGQKEVDSIPIKEYDRWLKMNSMRNLRNFNLVINGIAW